MEDTEEAFLISGYIVDAAGRGKLCSTKEELSEGEFQWLHFDYLHEETHRWLREESGLDPIVCDALLAKETRPRTFSHNNGLVLILRGVNLNPGSDPDDMVSVRLWVEQGRIISLRLRKIMAVMDIREALEEGRGPANTGEFVEILTQRLIDRMNPIINELNDRLDGLEDELVVSRNAALRSGLTELRRETIRLRRHLSPQREALAELGRASFSFFSEENRLAIRESHNRITRYVEELDSVRERSTVLQDELAARMAETLNQNMYFLSLVAGIFLPLAFLTGLLGINVAGIPGAENPLAFYEVCLGMFLILMVEVIVLKRLKWF